jgi:WS/DGAT/MGAT family acyltransferase
MWQFHVVERYRRGSALVVCIHHCYADGMALMRLLLSLTDAQPRQHALPARAVAASKDNSSWLSDLIKPAVAMTGGLVQGALDLFATAMHTAAHPQEATQLGKQGVAAGSELAKIALLSDDPSTPLKGTLSSHKQVAWGAPLPLNEIRTISKALGCTINDALLATIAGALGAYLRTRDFDTTGVTLRAMVPVNLRSADNSDPMNSPGELGNCFGLVFVNLPVGVRNPLARLYAVHQHMESLKQSPQASVAYWLLMTMGVVPQMIEQYAVDILTAKASAVISNVVGPPQALYFAGAKIEQQFFWVPQAGHIGIGVSALTYNGFVHFGIMADRNLIADPAQVVDMFNDEFEKLVLCTISGVSSETP